MVLQPSRTHSSQSTPNGDVVPQNGDGSPAGLDAVAAQICAELGATSVALAVYRPAWDDFEIAAVHGDDEARKRLLGLTRTGEVESDPLAIPLHDSRGRPLAIISVEPEPGVRTAAGQLDTIAAKATEALESLRRETEARRYRRALERLLEVSSELTRSHETRDVLQAVCEAITETLGFRLAVVELPDRDADRYVPLAGAGLDPSHADVQLTASIADLDTIFDPAFEFEGCYLLTREEALARVGTEPTAFRSTFNGRGLHAWDRHWLIVPLRDRAGGVMGFIWVDDPEDRLLPSKDQLQALRLFADQATSALVSAEQFEALRAAGEYQRSLIAAAPIAILSLDREGRIRSWNEAAERMLGWSEEEVLGMRPPHVPEEKVAEFEALFARVIAGETLNGVELTRVRRDGSPIDISLSVAPIRGVGGEVVGTMATHVDITDRNRTERELAAHNAELEALHATTLELLDRSELPGLIETIVARAGDLVGTPDGGVWLVDEERDELELVVGQGRFMPFTGTRLQRGEGLCGRVWVEERTLSVERYDAWPGKLARFEGLGLHANAAVPLRAGSKVVGVFGLGHFRPGRVFGEVELALLNRFGQLASLALEKARLYNDVREANERMRAIIEGAPLAIFSIDREGLVESWNPAAERMFGWTAEEAIGNRPPYLDEEGLHDADALNSRVLDGETIIGRETTRHRRDGSPIDLSVSGAPIRAADGTTVGVMSMSLDVSERKRVERSLERRNAELEALHGTTLELLDRLDLDSVLETIVARATDLLGTPHACLVLGEESDDHLRISVGFGLFAERVGTQISFTDGFAGRVLAEGQPVSVDDYLSWPGRAGHFDSSGLRALAGVPLRSGSGAIGVIAVGSTEEGRTFGESELALLSRLAQLASLALEHARLYEAARREVEERRAAEEALRTSQELYRNVVENSRDLILIVGLDGTFSFTSPSIERILGYQPTELVGTSSLEIIHPDDRRAVAGVVEDLIQRGRSSAYVARILHRNGHWVEMEGIPGAILDDSGATVAVLGVARDVTERRGHEEAEARLQEQLRQSQKMEAIGRLAGGVAHDFNNLLTAIMGYGELALAGLAPGAPTRRHVEEIKQAADSAAMLTRQLLAFSRRQVLQSRVLDLNDAVADVEGMLGRLLGDDVDLVTELDRELGCTRADPGQIHQVVMNLALNSRDAMPRGGRVTLRTANVELDELFVSRHVGAVAGEYVMLAVADTGEGMDAETLERIFEPFFTTKEPGKGTGLGLSTVYGIVKQTGGSIWAYSEPGEGTTIKVYLPRVRERANEREEPPPPAALGGSETVLLVEDEDVVRRLVRDLLEEAGYTVLEAADPEAALNHSRVFDGRIHALMTDVVMPGMSGPELATQLALERPETRVLFTSGYTAAAIASHGVLRPGTAFLEKPFTAAQLGERLRSLLDERLVA